MMQETLVPKPEPEIRVDSTDARAGSNEGVVRWVLVISLSLAIAALTVIWVTGALTQDNVESQGTAMGRAEAETEQREELAEQGDMIAPGTDESTQTPGPAAQGVAPSAD
jgi:hypothetical protein